MNPHYTVIVNSNFFYTVQFSVRILKVFSFCSLLVLNFSCTTRPANESNVNVSLENSYWKIVEKPCKNCFILEKQKSFKKIRKPDRGTYLYFDESKVRVINNCTQNYADFNWDETSSVLKIENMADGVIVSDCNPPDFPAGFYSGKMQSTGKFILALLRQN